jgi:DNA-binding CsgD family transcriptional regulator
VSADARAARRRARQRLWSASALRIEALGALSELFADEGLTRDRAIEESAAVLAELLGDAVVIDLLTPECDWMYPVGAHDADPRRRELLDRVRGIPFRADHGFTASVLERGETLLFPAVCPEEIHALQPEIAPVCKALGVTGFAIAPLAARGRCAGFLWQLRTGDGPRLSEDDRLFLHEVAVRVALGIETWRLDDALQLAPPDPRAVAGTAPLERLLTPRERAVFESIGRGDDDRVIAERLQLSARTVEWYRRRIQARLGVSDHAGLVAKARQHGLAAGSAVVHNGKP